MEKIHFERLKAHSRSSFSCGEAALDAYIHKQAGQDARRGFASVIVATDPSNPADILGYYTLSAASVALDKLPETLQAKVPRYKHVPAVLLGRLAVASAWQKRGIGALLLTDALLRAFTSEVAWAVFLVKAKHPIAANFYTHFGFSPFIHEALLLWISRQEVASLHQPKK